jgi:hypothetical protein
VNPLRPFCVRGHIEWPRPMPEGQGAWGVARLAPDRWRSRGRGRRTMAVLDIYWHLCEDR